MDVRKCLLETGFLEDISCGAFFDFDFTGLEAVAGVARVGSFSLVRFLGSLDMLLEAVVPLVNAF